MKNFSKTIAAISMSLLAVGAMAQVESNSLMNHIKFSPMRKAVGPAIHATHARPGVNTNSLQIFYPNTDGAIFGNSYSVTGTGFWSADLINGRYVEGDTGTYNFDLIHAATVAFDTILDGADNAYSAQSGSMKVDTVWALIGYANTSAINDTLVFSIDEVNPQGVPTTTTYTTINVPMYKGVTFGATKISGLNLDSLYYVYAVPNYTVPSGSRFAVSVSFLGPKTDTFELAYAFPYTTCTPYNYADAFTSCGHKYTDTRTINVNSYLWGFQEYFANTPTMEPQANGCIFNNGNYEWNICAASGDTMYFYQQDYAIAASVSFNDVTGVNNIAASGLSVGQNYPNPFNKETTINYSLTKSSNVTFTAYDMTGRIITTTNYGVVAPGQYQVNLSANTFSPGIYFYTFNVNGSTVTKKMVITE